ncbi:hypothetical protein AB0G29_20865 [Streptomyces parvus]|uniref:hypothetical protein n=1 Tax=Streptomyces parvus TaxID=66428 RepID=UPI0033D9B74F
MTQNTGPQHPGPQDPRQPYAAPPTTPLVLTPPAPLPGGATLAPIGFRPAIAA